MSKIGHNKPPRDLNWKSVSLNIYVHKELEEIKNHIQKQRDIHNPEMKKQRVTIPMAIEILSNQYYLNNILLPRAWENTKI
jgi:hypothetical protein